LPYALKLASLGYKEAMRADLHLRQGLNVCLGKITNQPVANDLGYEFVAPEKIL
jgi:alanine dehydrogenase